MNSIKMNNILARLFKPQKKTVLLSTPPAKKITVRSPKYPLTETERETLSHLSGKLKKQFVKLMKDKYEQV